MARPELRSLLGYDTVYIIYNIMPSFLNIFSAEKTKYYPLVTFNHQPLSDS